MFFWIGDVMNQSDEIIIFASKNSQAEPSMIGCVESGISMEDGVHLVMKERNAIEGFFSRAEGEIARIELVDESPSQVEKGLVSEVEPKDRERLKVRGVVLSSQQEINTIIEFVSNLRNIQPLKNDFSAQTPAAFVSQLAAESLRHRAVRHPYLIAMADGTFPDTRWALADFAQHYYTYSLHFPRYLTTVISRLENPEHRKALLENLTEESGIYEEEELEELAKFGVEHEWIKGIAHPLLFRRFSDAIGVRRSDVGESDQVVCWREQFLQVLSSGPPAEALGALGLGTENIVRTIYGPFVKAINRLGDISPRNAVFFPLHTAVDDHHQETLQQISADFAKSSEGRVSLRRGMLKALQLRCAFWDWLYERALNPDRAQEVI
jgi:pyrroloquinoline quinone (PQQ) biosynthesis protein C